MRLQWRGALHACVLPSPVQIVEPLRLRRTATLQLPSLGSIDPDEEFELQATRLAVDLGLDRRPACDERHRRSAHLAVGKACALILRLARSHRRASSPLVSVTAEEVEKLIACKRLYRLPVPPIIAQNACLPGRDSFSLLISIPSFDLRRVSVRGSARLRSDCAASCMDARSAPPDPDVS